jgi:hypothetical protein
MAWTWTRMGILYNRVHLTLSPEFLVVVTTVKEQRNNVPWLRSRVWNRVCKGSEARQDGVLAFKDMLRDWFCWNCVCKSLVNNTSYEWRSCRDPIILDLKLKEQEICERVSNWRYNIYYDFRAKTGTTVAREIILLSDFPISNHAIAPIVFQTDSSLLTVYKDLPPLLSPQ